MTEKKAPFVSIVTLIIMFFGAILSVSLWDDYIMGIMAIVWAICTAALFLCECLFGLIKKRFSSNVGAFIATAAMGVVLTVSLVSEFSDRSGGFLDFSGLMIGLYCIAFLPPMIVSLGVNIGNIIYKVRSGKTENPSDRQP